jgi:hypothetical protein
MHDFNFLVDIVDLFFFFDRRGGSVLTKIAAAIYQLVPISP